MNKYDIKRLKAKLLPWRTYISDETIEIRETTYYRNVFFERCEIKVFYPATIELSGKDNVFSETVVRGVEGSDNT